MKFIGSFRAATFPVKFEFISRRFRAADVKMISSLIAGERHQFKVFTSFTSFTPPPWSLFT